MAFPYLLRRLGANRARRLLIAWLLFALVWATTLGSYGVYRWANNPWRTVSERSVPSVCDHRPFPPWCVYWRTRPQTTAFDRYAGGAPSLWDSAVVVLVPPAVLLLLGCGFWWIARHYAKRTA